MATKQNRRIERTKRDFKVAYLDLIKERQNFSDITITEIAEQANYNRATFYSHYSDKESLLNEIIEEEIKGFIESFREPYKGKKTQNVKTLSRTTLKIFDYVKQRSEVFSVLFNSKIFPGFQQQLFQAIEDVFSKEIAPFGDSDRNINRELYTRATSYQLAGILNWWAEKEFEFSPRYMTEQSLKIYYNSPYVFRIREKESEEKP